MFGKLKKRLIEWFDASTTTLGLQFMDAWSKVERSYRRPFSNLAVRLKFAFYPLLALGAIAWLGWDWTHARSLSSAEDAIFDMVVQWRPFEPTSSGRVVVVEIDECSIEYFRARGEGGWPWSRQRHADLLDQLDRRGVSAVGFDVLFIDRSQTDPVGDQVLEAMANGGAGRFVFESTRLHPDYDAGSPLRASHAPGAFALTPHPRNDPKVALLLPYGEAMASFSAIANVTRDQDGVLRDIPLRETAGDWGMPALPLRLAAVVTPQVHQQLSASVRPNWRHDSRLPRISAADLLSGGSAGVPRRDDAAAGIAGSCGIGRLYGGGAERCETDTGRPGHAGRRSDGRGNRSTHRQQRNPGAAGRIEISLSPSYWLR